jgi:isoleucyl-tRNA synthetase
MLHPLSPYLSDYLYVICFSDRKSILLEDWPVSNASIVNIQVERSFDGLREIVSLTNAARMSAKLKRRWPINSVWICYGGHNTFDLESVLDILKVQINVQDCKVIRYRNDTKLRKILTLLENEVPIIPRTKLLKKNVGLKVKNNLEKVTQSFTKVDTYELLRTLDSSGKYLLTYGEGLLLELKSDDVELSYASADGYAIAENENTLVLIDARRDKDLVIKGLMRDLARNLQQVRKERGYNTTDIIASSYIAGLGEEEILQLQSMEEELKYLVRANNVVITKERVKDITYKMIQLEGRELHLSI